MEYISSNDYPWTFGLCDRLSSRFALVGCLGTLVRNCTGLNVKTRIMLYSMPWLLMVYLSLLLCNNLHCRSSRLCNGRINIVDLFAILQIRLLVTTVCRKNLTMSFTKETWAISITGASDIRFKDCGRVYGGNSVPRCRQTRHTASPNTSDILSIKNRSEI